MSYYILFICRTWKSIADLCYRCIEQNPVEEFNSKCICAMIDVWRDRTYVKKRFPNLRNTTFKRVQRFTWDGSLAAAEPYIEILALPPRIKPTKPLHRFYHFIFFQKIEEMRKGLKVYFWGYNADFATVIEPTWFQISLFASLLIIGNSICSTLERILRQFCF